MTPTHAHFGFELRRGELRVWSAHRGEGIEIWSSERADRVETAVLKRLKRNAIDAASVSLNQLAAAIDQGAAFSGINVQEHWNRINMSDKSENNGGIRRSPSNAIIGLEALKDYERDLLAKETLDDEQINIIRFLIQDQSAQASERHDAAMLSALEKIQEMWQRASEGQQKEADERQNDTFLHTAAVEAQTTLEPGDQPVPESNNSYSKTEIDAKLDRTEARIETQLATMRGEMREGFATMRGDMQALITNAVSQIRAENKISRLAIIGTVIASAIGVIAITIGIAGALYTGALADRANILSALGLNVATHQEAASAQPGKK